MKTLSNTLVGINMNEIILAGTVTSNVYKVAHEERYHIRLATTQSNSRIYFNQRPNINKGDLIAIKGHIETNLIDEDHIVVEQIAVFQANA